LMAPQTPSSIAGFPPNNDFQILVCFPLHPGFSLVLPSTMEALARQETPSTHHWVDSPAISWGHLENIQVHTLVGYQLTVRTLHLLICLSCWVGPL
jgi:hypothetical protein